MTAHWSTAVASAPDYVLDPLLATLRLIARQHRLSHTGAASGHPLSTLLRTLPQAIGRPLVFYGCGVAERSFDEDWLLAVFRAKLARDADSYRFLLNSRMSREAASRIHFEICHAHLTLDLFA